MVSYHFPPEGGVQVQRALKFAKYLPEFGWRPIILAAPADEDRVPRYDPGLLKQIPDVAAVYRTRTRGELRLRRASGPEATAVASPQGGEPPRSGGSTLSNLANLLERWLLIPDRQVTWAPSAIATGLRVIRKERPDVIFATAPPFTSLVVGTALSRLSRLPLVLDYRDIWTDEPSRIRPWLPQKASEWLEKMMLRRAGKVVTAGERLGKRLVLKYGLPQPHVATISNGFDAEDMKDLPRLPKPDCFTIVFTGVIFGADVLRPFFSALASLPANVRADMRAIFVGGLDPEHLQIVKSMGLDAVVETHPFAPHREALAYQAMADLLLLVFSSSLEGDWQISGKLLEYLGSGKPILAIVPEGAAADIVRKTGAGVVVAPTDQQGIVRAIETLYHNCQDGPFNRQAGCTPVECFDRRWLTSSLACLLDEVTSSK